MTLSTGATSDGNGGWASVRFNGKSNQQNYLNYDGVDGTYVWDASPGYLNATGSQFRLADVDGVDRGISRQLGAGSAESGLGAGGNITVVSKSGGNALNGSIFNYLRNDALDAASKSDDRKQELELNQFGGSLGGPIVAEPDVLFRQLRGSEADDGSDFTEAVPSDEAIRRIRPGSSSRPQARRRRRSHARRGAAARRLPRGTVATANPLLALATLSTQAEQKEHSFSAAVDHRFNNNHGIYARILFSDGEVDTPDRTVTPRRVLATQIPEPGLQPSSDHRHAV